MARSIGYAVGGCCCKGKCVFVADTVEPEGGGGETEGVKYTGSWCPVLSYGELYGVCM